MSVRDSVRPWRAVCSHLGLLIALTGVSTTQAGLSEFSSLVVADRNPATAAPRQSIRVTYLGVNGYQFETGRHVLLIDPYFTRVGFWNIAANQPIRSNAALVDAAFRHLQSRADAVLVTHGHFDHLLDVPNVVQRTGARLVSGPSVAHLAQSLGVSPNQCTIVGAGDVRRIGPWTIHVLPARHDTLFGSVPFAGRSEAANHAPVRPPDWVVGEPLAFLIEAAGKRIYVDSGGMPGSPPGAQVHPVDLAILGVALPDSRRRYAEAVTQLHPRYVLPSHQDDFFAPMNRGFVFGAMTSFPTVKRLHDDQHLPGRIILLDYFKPWTLP